MEPSQPTVNTTDSVTHNDDTQNTSSNKLVNESEQDCEAPETPLATPESSDGIDEEGEDEEKPTLCRRLINFYRKNEFLILVVFVILLAKAYPPLGAQYLAEEITAGWLAVIIIFLLAGLTTDTKAFSQAFLHLRFNVVVQCYNFFVDSAVVFGISRGLLALDALPQSLADGLVITSCLPLAISMVAVLTRAAGGDDASAIFHEALGNFLGIFLSPALILGYLGVEGSVNMVEVFYRLIIRVVVPVLLGQGLKRFSPAVVAFSDKHENLFTKIKQYVLLFIIYTVFCGTFANDSKNASLGDIFLLAAIIFGILIFLMLLSWTTFYLFFRDSTKLRVTALFATTHKTIALGIPLITTMYEKDPNLGLYTVPLIMWYSTQLVIGSLIVPKLKDWVVTEQKRLGAVDCSDEMSCDDSAPSSTSDNQEVDPEALPEQK